MTCRLEDLAQNILSDPLVETAYIQRSLIGLWGCATRKGRGGGGGHETAIVKSEGRSYGDRNGIVILGYKEGRGSHMALVGAILAVVVLGWSDIGHGML